MSNDFFANMAGAQQHGVDMAAELVTIANTSDMGDIREDATIEAIARLMRAVPKDLWGLAFSEAVKCLAIALAVYSDGIQGRDPLNPTDAAPH